MKSAGLVPLFFVLLDEEGLEFELDLTLLQGPGGVDPEWSTWSRKLTPKERCPCPLEG